MKKLSGIFLGLCLICLSSVQARADGERAGNVYFPPNYTHFVPTYHAPVSHAQQMDPQDNQSVQQWETSNGAVQELKQK